MTIKCRTRSFSLIEELNKYLDHHKLPLLGKKLLFSLGTELEAAE